MGKNTIKINESALRNIIKESVKNVLKENQGTPTPAIYVGTYGKYNSGSLEGAWVDLTNFGSYEEFVQYIRNLHKNERDPEFMFQDYEYIPKIFISESHIDPRFWDFMNDTEHSYAIKEAVADNVSDVDEYFNQIEDITVYPDCKDMTDVAYYCVEEFGFPKNAEAYFDYEAYGRALDTEGRFIDSEDGVIELN